MSPFFLLSQAVGLGGASGTRAGWSLLAVAVAAHAGRVVLPPELEWMGSPQALAGFGVLLAFEWLTERDEDAHLLLGLVQYGLSAAAGALTVMASLQVSTEGLPPWVLGAGGALFAVGTLGLRRRLYEELADLESELFHPLRWLHRLEEGGVVGLCLAIFLAAPLALGGVVLAVSAGVLAGLLARKLEARFRRPCPGCGAAIREEASRCPSCRAEVPVEGWVDLRLGGDAVRGALDGALASLRRPGAT
ncbi:MAG TPA: DUF4126 domain-containing protein [Myxococcaceae bacterium]|nr:DUF4126 domain-containing protein [Myxococcaceae bacterium]